MPIYEYRRPDGSTFELMQSFSEPALKKDPETGVAVERVLHAPAVHFKGKGFYNTDYGTRKRQRETAAAGEGSGNNGSGKEGGGSDGTASTDGSSASKTSVLSVTYPRTPLACSSRIVASSPAASKFVARARVEALKAEVHGVRPRADGGAHRLGVPRGGEHLGPAEHGGMHTPPAGGMPDEPPALEMALNPGLST